MKAVMQKAHSDQIKKVSINQSILKSVTGSYLGGIIKKNTVRTSILYSEMIETIYM